MGSGDTRLGFQRLRLPAGLSTRRGRDSGLAREKGADGSGPCRRQLLGGLAHFCAQDASRQGERLSSGVQK